MYKRTPEDKLLDYALTTPYSLYEIEQAFYSHHDWTMLDKQVSFGVANGLRSLPDVSVVIGPKEPPIYPKNLWKARIKNLIKQ